MRIYKKEQILPGHASTRCVQELLQHPFAMKVFHSQHICSFGDVGIFNRKNIFVSIRRRINI